MKIKVQYEASQSARRDSFDTEDMGITDNEWVEMSEDNRRELLMSMVESDQPYWAVDFYEEDEEN